MDSCMAELMPTFGGGVPRPGIGTAGVQDLRARELLRRGRAGTDENAETPGGQGREPRFHERLDVRRERGENGRRLVRRDDLTEEEADIEFDIVNPEDWVDHPTTEVRHERGGGSG